jgi:hypothetical protein
VDAENAFQSGRKVLPKFRRPELNRPKREPIQGRGPPNQHPRRVQNKLQFIEHGSERRKQYLLHGVSQAKSNFAKRAASTPKAGTPRLSRQFRWCRPEVHYMNFQFFKEKFKYLC